MDIVWDNLFACYATSTVNYNSFRVAGARRRNVFALIMPVYVHGTAR